MWHRYITKDSMRQAIAEVVNAIFQIRRPEIWGEGTTACASDSKKFGAWDQNLMTEWHARYGGPGIMIYWHVERRSACIYSQLKTCSSSEVAAMIEGVLRHCTEMSVDKQLARTNDRISPRPDPSPAGISRANGCRQHGANGLVG